MASSSGSPRRSVSSTSVDTELRKSHKLIKKYLADTQSKISKETSS